MMNTAQIKDMIIKLLDINAEDLVGGMDDRMENNVRSLIGALSWDDVAGVLQSATSLQMRNVVDGRDNNMTGEEFTKALVTRIVIMEIDAHFGVR